MRRWTAVIAALGVFSLSTPVFAQSPTTTTFSDLGSTPWATGAINLQASQGVVNGIGNGKFDPNAWVTEAQAAVMISRLLRAKGTSPSPVSVPSWAKAGVGAAYSLKILRQRFQPTQFTSRARFTVMLVRALKAVGVSITPPTTAPAFVDSAAIPSYAQNDVAWAVANGIITGYPSGSGTAFGPSDPLTRAQVAVMLTRALAFLPHTVLGAHTTEGILTGITTAPTATTPVGTGTITTTTYATYSSSTGATASGLVLVLKRHGQTITVPVASNAEAYIGGKTKSLTSLWIGNRVIARLNSLGNAYLVVERTHRSPKREKQNSHHLHKINSTIIQIHFSLRQIVLADGKTLTVPQQTPIRIKDHLARLADLRAHDSIKVWYRGHKVAKIAAKPAKEKKTTSHIARFTGHRLILTNGDAFSLATRVIISYQGSNIGPRHLRRGLKVKVWYISHKAYRIKIKGSLHKKHHHSR